MAQPSWCGAIRASSHGTVVGTVPTGTVTGTVVRGTVTGGLVTGGLVVRGFVAGVVEAGTVLGGSVVAGAVIAGTVVGLIVRTAVVVVELAGVFGRTSCFEVLDESSASATPAISKTATVASAIVDHNGHRRSRRAEPAPGNCARTAGRTAVASSGGTTGTGSVGSSSGGYHRPSAASHQPGSSGR
jgi:hypothetical protein